MPIAKETGGNYTPAPEGTHIARCFAVIALGTQHSENYADTFKVMLCWELPNDPIEIDGKKVPMTISKEYTLSLGKKANLRRDLESWRGRGFNDQELKGFEVANVVGKACLLSIVHKKSGKGSTYAAIQTVASLTKQMSCPPQFHPTITYEIAQGRDTTFNGLPEWIRKKIEICEEWTNPPIDKEDPAAEPVGVGDDDVPF